MEGENKKSALIFSRLMKHKLKDNRVRRRERERVKGGGLFFNENLTEEERKNE